MRIDDAFTTWVNE